MSNTSSNVTTSTKGYNTNSMKNRIYDTAHGNIRKKGKIEDAMPKLKMDYKSNNYFYNEIDCFKEYPPYNKRIRGYYYTNSNENKRQYNIESNSSHITVENEDGYIKHIPNKNYNSYNYSNYNYNNIPIQNNNNYIEIGSHKNEYYDDNSEYSENNDGDNDNENDNENDNIYYDNEDYENDNGILTNDSNSNMNSPGGGVKYQQYQENIHLYLAPTKKNPNIFNNAQEISHEIQFSNDNNLKMRPIKKNITNCGNNTTTTNNTFNNNIYYINPINLKNKKNIKEKNNIITNNSNNKLKKYNYNNPNNRKNFIYKSVDITHQKKKINKEKERERDYLYKFNIINNNYIEKSQRDLFLKSIVLIQSMFRGYLVKIKLYNNVNLYVCIKQAIDLLEELFLKKKIGLWKDFVQNMTFVLEAPSSPASIRSKYKIKNNKKKESLLLLKQYNQYHKESGDSFNIITQNTNKENNEKLKSKLDIVMKENNDLKNQLLNNKNLETKLKILVDENKKNQNINAIIMKDNQQLAKKLKDIKDYRNNTLLIENQYSYDLNKMIIIQELNDNNEKQINKLKKVLLFKILYKKINNENNLIKEKLNIYRKNVHILNDKEKEKKATIEFVLKIIAKIIEKQIYLLKSKCFLCLCNYYYSKLLLEKEEQKIKEEKNKSKLQKFFFILEKKNNCMLNKMRLKLWKNLQYKQSELKEEEKIKKREEFLSKIFIKYEKNIRVIYKVFLERWNLRAKIIGIRTAARDKKKKRKQKKKNNRILFNQQYAINKKNYGTQMCKSIHEFSYIVTNGSTVKESSPNGPEKLMLSGNKSTKNVNVKKNINENSPNNININLGEKEITKNKNKSVNKRKVYKDKKENLDKNINDKENINLEKDKDNINNEESDEDSGESFGLDNNSD